MRNEKREKLAAFAIEQYQAGVKVRHICEACGITAPTLYRLLKTSDSELTERREWNKTGLPNQKRVAGSSRSWARRGTKEERILRHSKKGTPCLEILERIGIGLSVDNLGHCLVREEKRLYLTDNEFNLLLKRPVELLKAIAPRINAMLRSEVGS